MTVVGTIRIVSEVRIQAGTREELHQAARDLHARIGFSIPKLRFGAARIIERQTTISIPVSVELPKGGERE